MNAALPVPEPAVRSPRPAVRFLFGLVAVMGVVSGFYDGRHWPEPLWWTVLAAGVLNYAIFAWYCRDTDARGIRRSRGGNLFVILLAPLAVPVYLLRRASGQRWRALLRMALFLLLFFVVEMLGMIAGELLA